MAKVWLCLAALSLAFAQLPINKTEQEERSRDTYEGAYAPNEPLRFNPESNAFLMQCIKNRKPGRALDVGMGNGRNSIALAQAGWNVTGFDIASVGVEQARKKAREQGLSLNALVQSEQQFEFGVNQWDLIVLTYQPFRDILARVKTGLTEGGIVVVENFQRDTRRYRLMGSGSTLGNNEALQLFSDFRILRYEDVDGKPDWGIEFPQNRLVRLMAQKGDPPQLGCDWKGSPKAEGAEVMWGAVRLRCTASGWQAFH